MSDPFEPTGAPSPAPPRQRGMSNSVAGGLFLVAVALLCAIGWYLSRPPGLVPSGQGSNAPPGKAGAAPSEQSGSIPTGWVRVVNRKTGKVIHLNAHPVKIEPAGQFYKLKSRDGRYVSLAGWAKDGDEGAGPHGTFRYGRDSGSPSLLWKIEPCGNGFWTITSCQSKKCLVAAGPTEDPAQAAQPFTPTRQATFREGALEQQWRFVPVESPTPGKPQAW